MKEFQQIGCSDAQTGVGAPRSNTASRLLIAEEKLNLDAQECKIVLSPTANDVGRFGIQG